MKKGVTTFFGFDYNNFKDKLKDIKEAGFDYYLTTSDENFFHQNGKLEEEVAYCKKIGLTPDSIHSKYETKILPLFWEEGEDGEIILERLKYDLTLAKKYSFKALVVHILGDPSDIGLKRMKDFVSYAESIQQTIALENVENALVLDYVFTNIDSKYLKFCYDIGHANLSKSQKNVLSKYLDRLICLHLHDNNGEKDLHTLNKYGNINWEEFAKILAQASNVDDICLSYELIMRYRGNETAKDVLSECFKQAVELESMVEKFKKMK